MIAPAEFRSNCTDRAEAGFTPAELYGRVLGSVQAMTAAAAEIMWVGTGERRALGIPARARTRDSEGTAPWEEFGRHGFAWLPRRCRNGRLRWLTVLERHRDGTFTLGRLA